MSLSVQDAKLIAQALTERGVDVPEDIARIAYPRRIVNLTPHSVTIITENLESVASFPAADPKSCVRVLFKKTVKDVIDDVLIFGYSVSSVVNLPEPEPGTYYIVSSLVASALPERSDLLNVAGIIRDDSMCVIGGTHLAHYGEVNHGEE